MAPKRTKKAKRDRGTDATRTAFCLAAKHVFQLSDFTKQVTLAKAAGTQATVITDMFTQNNAYGNHLQNKIAKALGYTWEEMIDIGLILHDGGDPDRLIKKHGSFNFPNRLISDYPEIVKYAKTFELLDSIADETPDIAHVGFVDVLSSILEIIKKTKPGPVKVKPLADKPAKDMVQPVRKPDMCKVDGSDGVHLFTGDDAPFVEVTPRRLP